MTDNLVFFKLLLNDLLSGPKSSSIRRAAHPAAAAEHLETPAQALAVRRRKRLKLYAKPN